MSTSEFCFFSYTRTSYPLFTSRNRYIRRLIVFRGAGLVTNLCRCNIYSPLFSWKTYNSTTDLLYYGDEPILSYIIGFAKASNLEKPVILPSNQWVKDVTLLPLGHEFERLTGAVAMLAKDPKPRFRCYDNGLKANTGLRFEPNPNTSRSSSGTLPRNQLSYISLSQTNSVPSQSTTGWTIWRNKWHPLDLNRYRKFQRCSNL